MLPTDEPPPDEPPKPEAPPPSNKHMMDMAILVSRTYEEEERSVAFNAAIIAMNVRRLPGWILAPGPLPEDHPFYALVGRVASEWAHLEHILDLTIWELLGGKEELTACITSQIMGVGPRCKTIFSLGLARGLTKEHVKPFHMLRKGTFDVADWRARWVHDPWFVHEGTKPAQFRAMPEIDPRFGLQDISEEEIKKTIRKINELQHQARIAQKIVLDALSSLPERRA